MTANTAHAPEQLPPHPMQLRKPIKRAAAETSTMFEKPAAPAKRAASAPAGPAVPATPAPATPATNEPSFWTHVDGLLESLPVKQAAEAIGQQLDQGTKALKNVGRDALASVASLAPRSLRNWAKQAAPPPPSTKTSSHREKREAVAELGSFLVDLHVEETRVATNAFLACVAHVAALIDEAETAREIACLAAHGTLTALLGDAPVDEAMAHVPTTRHVVDMYAKRSRMTSGTLAQAMRLVGNDWQRDPNAGAGKLVLHSATFTLAVDVTFATFRVRDRATARCVDLTGSLIEEVEADAYFTATHFRIDA
jgi:hypothetical protein